MEPLTMRSVTRKTLFRLVMSSSLVTTRDNSRVIARISGLCSLQTAYFIYGSIKSSTWQEDGSNDSREVIPTMDKEGQNQQSSPPVSASGQKPQLRVDTHSQSITRNPVMGAVTEYNTPDSLNDLAHLIEESVLDKIAPIKQNPSTAHAQQEVDEDDGFVLDEDTLDRGLLALIQKVLSGGDSDSDYGDSDSPQPTLNAAGKYPNDYDDDKPDNASSVEEDIAPHAPPLNAKAPKAGRMKVIGVKVDPEVVVGDAHYRPGGSAQKETMGIPKVDFGTTFSHGRQLSGEIKPAAVTESITARAANGGANAAGANGTNYDTRKAMSTGDFLTSYRPGPGSVSDSQAGTNRSLRPELTEGISVIEEENGWAGTGELAQRGRVERGLGRKNT